MKLLLKITLWAFAVVGVLAVVLFVLAVLNNPYDGGYGEGGDGGGYDSLQPEKTDR